MTNVLHCITMTKIKQLIWNGWNIEHIGKHKISVSEVEEACRAIIKSFKSYRERLIVLGKTKKGRLLTIVLVPETKNKYYVVTARDSSKKEKRMLNDKS